MKFNMGCGHNRRDGYLNVDSTPACQPDEVWDLERTPWPWPDNCAEEVLFIHSLEHMGGDPEVFLAIMKELYRIAAPGGSVIIHAPHPRHDHYLHDPTHVRPITGEMLLLFDRAKNDEWRARGGSNTPLAHYAGVDFRVAGVQNVLAEPYASDLQAGRMTREAVTEAIRSRNNVIVEQRITLEVRKP